MLPDFLIIGVSRSGTTSIYNYLTMHPNVIPAFRKEIHYFERNFHRGINWYKSFFPTQLYKYIIRFILKRRIITGEATPGYILYPSLPKKVFSLLPNVKLIILLRNPVDRAYSHYKYIAKLGKENLSFKIAIKKEQERIKNELEKALNDENYDSDYLRQFSYLARGIYIDQIKNWRNFFPKNHFLIIKSEGFFENPSNVLKQVCRFLEIPYYKVKNFKKFSSGISRLLDSKTREFLISYFEPYNKSLYNYLDINFDWDK